MASKVLISKGTATGKCSNNNSRPSLTEANYVNSVTLLGRLLWPMPLDNQSTYGGTYMPSLANSLSNLWIFYDSVESHIRGLASLRKSKASYSELLVPIILEKLPTDIQRNLSQEYSTM